MSRLERLDAIFRSKVWIAFWVAYTSLFFTLYSFVWDVHPFYAWFFGILLAAWAVLVGTEWARSETREARELARRWEELSRIRENEADCWRKAYYRIKDSRADIRSNNLTTDQIYNLNTDQENQ